MHIMWFTERQYHYDPETEPERSALLESQILRNRSFFGLPNANFDPAQGSMLLNEYLDEKIYSEELGFDGLMLNEHHGTPFCLGSRIRKGRRTNESEWHRPPQNVRNSSPRAPSAPSRLNFRVEPLQFNPGFVDRELPIDGSLLLVDAG